jgi:hypothetical protein
MHGHDVAMAVLIPEDDHVATVQSALRVGRFLQHCGAPGVNARRGDAPRGALLNEGAAALDGDGHLPRSDAQLRIDAGGPVSKWLTLATEEEMEDVAASSAEAVVGVDEICVGRFLERAGLGLAGAAV